MIFLQELDLIAGQIQCNTFQRPQIYQASGKMLKLKETLIFQIWYSIKYICSAELLCYDPPTEVL